MTQNITTTDPIYRIDGPRKKFDRTPPEVIARAQVEKAKNQFKPSFRKCTDEYYIQYHHGRTVELMKQYQNRFLCGLMAAVSEWVLWRIAAACRDRVDFERAFQKVDALYAGAVFPEYLNDNMKDVAIGHFSKRFKDEAMSDKERDCIEALDMLLLCWSYNYPRYEEEDRVYGTWKKSGDPFMSLSPDYVIILAGAILSGNAKTQFNIWFKDVLARAEPEYLEKAEQKSRLIPREFFWKQSCPKDDRSLERLCHSCIDSFDPDNPYVSILHER